MENTGSTKTHYLKSMGIMQWVRRAGDVVDSQEVAPLPKHEVELVAFTPPADVNNIEQPSPANKWELLQRTVKHCILCELHQSRTQTVFGVGDPNANWMIIGEAPGAEEDREGEPFVGRAGKLLNNMLLAIGLKRDDVFIGNILKCRPPNNRDPRPEEVVHCEQYLQQQIALIKPKIILAVGRIAAQNLLKTQENLGRMRGKPFEYGPTKIPVIVTYHPAYLLRSPNEKRKAWQDLQLASQIVGQE